MTVPNFVATLGFIAPEDFDIIWLFILMTLIVRDEGYSRNAPCTLNEIFTFLLRNDLTLDFL